MTVYTLGLNTGNTGSVLDAAISQSSPASPQGPFAGNYIEQSNAGSIGRMLYGFTGLPSGSGTVTGAALTIQNADTQGSTLSVELRELLSDFVENNATWNIRDTAINWNVSGVLTGTDVASTVLATGTLPTASDTYFTLTGAGLNQLVQDWITGAKTHHGVIVSIVSDTSAGGGGRRLRTSQDADGIRPYLTFDFTAGGGSPTVSTVSSNNANEGASIVHTVTLSAAVSGSAAVYAITLAGGTATGGGTDYTSTLTNGMFSNGVTVSGGNITVPIGVSSFTVTIPTAFDSLAEGNETYILSVGGVTGTGTITESWFAKQIRHAPGINMYGYRRS